MRDRLQHHGIKGQKWGVRRFQNKDGSLTPAGKRRYDDGDGKRTESVTIGGQTFKVYGRNSKQYADKAAKKARDIGAEVSRESKVKEKKTKTYKIPEKKSLHRLKLEEKYMKSGMTREEAEQAASKRIRSEKFVAAAAAVTVTSAVAYAKYKGYTSDKIIKENSDFQRIMRLSENQNIRKSGRQYLALDSGDKIKYKGFLSRQLQSQDGRQTIYDVTVKNKNKLTVASRKKVEDTFLDLYKNDMDFKNLLRGEAITGGDDGKLGKIAKKIAKDEKMSDHELRKKAYDYFNVMLAEQNPRMKAASEKFYDKLSEKGINAIIDENDRKYSGYKAKMPIITFDGIDYEYIKRAMNSDEINANYKKAEKMITRPELIKQGAILVTSYSSIPVINKSMMDKKILQYKQDHPNTKMSDAEIKAMIKEELQKGGGNSK